MLPVNYSGTKCPKCENTKFELTEDTPLAPGQSNYKYYYLRCAKCKTFLAAFDFTAIGGIIVKMADKLGVKVD